jgi:hypothetical protein
MFDRLDRGVGYRKMVNSQQLDGMAEADAVRPHHPVDGRAARVARAQAVPEVLRRSDDQRWVMGPGISEPNRMLVFGKI